MDRHRCDKNRVQGHTFAIMRRRAKTSLSTEINKTIKSLIITLSTMIAVLLIVFLAVTNSNAEKGYTLEQQKLKNQHLKSENSKITRKVSNSGAYSNIEENPKVEQMEVKEEKAYVTEEDNRIK